MGKTGTMLFLSLLCGVLLLSAIDCKKAKSGKRQVAPCDPFGGISSCKAACGPGVEDEVESTKCGAMKCCHVLCGDPGSFCTPQPTCPAPFAPGAGACSAGICCDPPPDIEVPEVIPPEWLEDYPWPPPWPIDAPPPPEYPPPPDAPPAEEASDDGDDAPAEPADDAPPAPAPDPAGGDDAAPAPAPEPAG